VQEIRCDNDDNFAFAVVSSLLSKLLQSVRDMASTPTLPKICLDIELASGLVKSTVGITEETVRRGVA